MLPVDFQLWLGQRLGLRKIGRDGQECTCLPLNLRGTSYSSRCISVRVPPCICPLPTLTPRCPPTHHFPLGMPKCKMQKPGQTHSQKTCSGRSPLPQPAHLHRGSWCRVGLRSSFSQQTIVEAGSGGYRKQAGGTWGKAAAQQAGSVFTVQWPPGSLAGPGLGGAGGRGLSLNFPLGIMSPHQAGPESRAGLPCPPGTSQRALGGAEGAVPCVRPADPGAFSSCPSTGLRKMKPTLSRPVELRLLSPETSLCSSL